MVPKILVTTGCSYGKFADVFSKKLITNTNDLELVIDLHSVSMGSNFQMISIIESVDKLLEMGIDNKDIFVLGQFSEIIRKDIVIQNDLLVNSIDNAFIQKQVNYPDRVIIKHTEFSKKVLENLVIKKIDPGDYPKFKNYYIINPEKDYQSNFPDETIQSILDSYVSGMNIQFNNGKKIDKRNVEFIDRAIRYFQNILTTEQYLKSKGIKYKFCLINNQFSMYNESGLQNIKKTNFVKNEHYLFQDYKNSKQIWDINSIIRLFYNMIDWNNWWFYEIKDKNIIWGGIDEFAIHNYGMNGYVDKSNKDLFGQHPTAEVYYDLIINHLMKEYF